MDAGATFAFVCLAHTHTHLFWCPDPAGSVAVTQLKAGQAPDERARRDQLLNLPSGSSLGASAAPSHGCALGVDFNKQDKTKEQKKTTQTTIMLFSVSAAKQKKKASLTQILLPIRFPFVSFPAPCRRKAFLSFWWTDGLMFAGRRKLLAPKVTKLGRAERTRGAPRHRRMVLFYQMNPRASSPFHLAPAVKLRLEKYAPNAPHIY